MAGVLKQSKVEAPDFSDGNSRIDAADRNMASAFTGLKEGIKDLAAMKEKEKTDTINISKMKEEIDFTNFKAGLGKKLEVIQEQSNGDPLFMEQGKNALIDEIRNTDKQGEFFLNKMQIGKTDSLEAKVGHVNLAMAEIDRKAAATQVTADAQEAYKRIETEKLFGKFDPAVAESIKSAMNYNPNPGGIGQGDIADISAKLNPNGTDSGGNPVNDTRSPTEIWKALEAKNLADNGDYVDLGEGTTLPNPELSEEQSAAVNIFHNASGGTPFVGKDLNTFEDVRNQGKEISQSLYEAKVYNSPDNMPAFGPYQIILSHVNDNTYKKAGLPDGDKSPLTLENQKEIAKVLWRERIFRTVGDSSIDKTFVGLGNVKDEIFKEYNISDLKGSTLIKLAKERHGDDYLDPDEQVNALFDDMEEYIIKNEGGEEAFAAVQASRAANAPPTPEESAQTIQNLTDSLDKVGNGQLNVGDLSSESDITRAISGLLGTADNMLANTTGRGINDFSAAAGNDSPMVEVLQNESLDWVNGDDKKSKVDNILSIGNAIKSEAAKLGMEMNDATTYQIIKNSASPDWFGSDAGKSWGAGGSNREKARELVKTAVVGDAVKYSAIQKELQSGKNILMTEGNKLIDNTKILREYINTFMLRGGNLRLSPSEVQKQLMEDRGFKKLSSTIKGSTDKLKRVSSNLLNNPKFRPESSMDSDGNTNTDTPTTVDVNAAKSEADKLKGMFSSNALSVM
mgnify:CR=1 FL=1